MAGAVVAGGWVFTGGVVAVGGIGVGVRGAGGGLVRVGGIGIGVGGAGRKGTKICWPTRMTVRLPMQLASWSWPIVTPKILLKR
jgi:hypothetical protein